MRKPILVFILLLITNALYSYVTGIETRFGNYGLSEYKITDTKYESYFQWGSSLFFEESAGIDENMYYGFKLERDPVMGYNLSSNLSFKKEYYAISFGPVFGIVNESWSLIKPGFSGAMKAELPGWVFAELGGGTIPAQSSGTNDDYSSYSGYYSIGFYLNQSHILCNFTQKIQNYTSLSGDEPYTNQLVDYILYTDYFTKGSLFKLKTKLGYEVLTKTFYDSNTIEIRDILFGLRTDFFINTSATVYLGIDNKIYPTSYGDIELSSVPFYLITVESGFIWKH